MQKGAPDEFADFPQREGAALVVGGSGGIGAAICARLAAAGSDVVITYRSNGAAAKQAAKEAECYGRAAHIYPVNVTDHGNVQELFDAVARNHGPVHSIINATGANIAMHFLGEVPPDEMRTVLDVEVNGFFNIVSASLPHMRKNGGSYVTLSTAGLSRWPSKDALSVVPKAAVRAIIAGIAKEEGRFGIRANIVALGLINAGIFQRLADTFYDEKYMQAAIKNSALKRIGTAEEVAEAVVFFASHRARFVTGQTLTLDGGYSL